MFQDPEGEHARRALQRGGGQFPGGHGPDAAPGMMNLPPSILNNPNIPPEVISNLQAGRLGSTIFVANVSLKLYFITLMFDLCKTYLCSSVLIKRRGWK